MLEHHVGIEGRWERGVIQKFHWLDSKTVLLNWMMILLPPEVNDYGC